MTDLLAVLTLMFWPVIPVFWIPVHLGTGFFRRLGFLTYILPFLICVPIAYGIYHYRTFLIQPQIDMPALVNIMGFPLLLLGTFLHIWTAKLLGFLGIIGIPELSPTVQMGITRKGAFSIVRHPTYFAHTVLFIGVFLITEVAWIGIITVLDFIVVNLIIIPLEEKELQNRFGEKYSSYKKDVPWRLIPWIF